MNTLPGMNADVGLGGVDRSLPDWRTTALNDQDPDDEEITTPADVVAILGFDPAEEK
jgi:hypothetical protein